MFVGELKEDKRPPIFSSGCHVWEQAKSAAIWAKVASYFFSNLMLMTMGYLRRPLMLVARLVNVAM